MKYFVTGATGFVGGVLVKQLRQLGHEVHAIVRDPGKASGLQSIGVGVFEGDVTDKDSMREAMRGVDGAYHVAGWYKIGAKDKRDAERVNVQGTRNVLELMRELEIPRGVYTSTCAINSDTNSQVVDETYRFHGRHLTEYDRTKAAAHEIAAEYIAQGLPLIIVMPGMIYGPGDTSPLRANIIDFLLARLPMVPARTGYCMAHVEDTVRGHILAMEKGAPGETYIIAGQPYRIRDVFRLASELTGKRAPRVVPHPILKVLSVLVRPFDSLLPDAYTSEGLRVLAGVTYWGDNAKARRELGFDPRPFAEGWAETLRHEKALLGQ